MSRLMSGLCSMLMASSLAFGLESPQPAQRAIRVECHGQLRTGGVAIGGETTGTTIKFDGVVWELQLKDEASRAFAESHHKQFVSVTGSLRKQAGVEVPARWIVDVERLVERDAQSPKAGATVTFLGKLRTMEAGGKTTILIEADGISWPLDLTADPSLAAKAESLASKPALIKGQLQSVTKANVPPHIVLHVNHLDTPPKTAE